MKSITISVSMAILVFGGAILAQTQTASVEQELLKLVQDWMNAEFKADMSSCRRPNARTGLQTLIIGRKGFANV